MKLNTMRQTYEEGEMNERLHPDGLPVSAAPFHHRYRDHLNRLPDERADELERRAREAEARVAELERELAWLRTKFDFRGGQGYDFSDLLDDIYDHLDSKPPEGWKP